MNFNEINPYVRHVRYLHPDGPSCYQPYILYDARLFYAFDGCGDIGQNTYTLSKGDIMIINSSIEYHLKTPCWYKSDGIHTHQKITAAA